MTRRALPYLVQWPLVGTVVPGSLMSQADIRQKRRRGDGVDVPGYDGSVAGTEFVLR